MFFMRVCKFGGSSLSCADGFRQAGGIVQSAPDRRCIVVSAPGRRSAQDDKLTDLLYACHAAAVQGRAYGALFDRIAARFEEIAHGLHMPLPAGMLDAARRMAASASAMEAASAGERMCGRLMARYLDCPFIDAAQVIRFMPDGALDAQATRRLLCQRMQGLPRAVLPGFYGATAAGAIVTFARGGGDITGALAAQALNATLYENFTDVCGVLRADPRIIPDAPPVDRLTYRELKALSLLGAGVLHADAIVPAHQAGVPTRICSTFAPEQAGTLVTDTLPDAARRGYLLAGCRNMHLLSLREPLDSALSLPTSLPAPLLASRSPGMLRMLFPTEDQRFAALVPSHAVCPCDALAIIGPTVPGLTARIASTLLKLGIQGDLLIHDPDAFYLTLPAGTLPDATRALYDALIRC